MKAREYESAKAYQRESIKETAHHASKRARRHTL